MAYQTEGEPEQRVTPTRLYLVFGIIFGLCIGVILGLFTDTIGIGIGIGLALGVVVGMALDQWHAYRYKQIYEAEDAEQ